jgi:hypothetical protein
MKDIKNRKCSYLGCSTKPSFGDPITGVPEYCSTHKAEGHENVISPKCLECGKIAHYGVKRREYCLAHRTAGMRVIGARYCNYVDDFGDTCPVRATFGHTHNHVAVKCQEHKLDDMVDVLNTKCINEDCAKLATVGPLFARLTHCVGHKIDGEYHDNHPKCSYDACSKKAYCAKDLKAYPDRCVDHTIDGYINIIERICTSCGLPNRIPLAYDRCYMCRDHSNDDIRKKKELNVKSLLTQALITFTQHDKRVVDGCSRYRPDFVIDVGTFFIVVECDENQHGSYSPECEKTRMLQIFQDFGMPVQFVRYNPDSYIDSNGVKVVSKARRETTLIETIKRLMTWEVPEFTVAAIYIAYDGFDGKPVNTNLNYEEYLKGIDRQKS